MSFPRFTLFLCLLLAGCTKTPPPDPVAEDRLSISQSLGGAVQVRAVHPPIGPFGLVTPDSRYYQVRLTDGSVYWAEAYWSKWTIGPMVFNALGGGNDTKPIYRYRYWRETHLPLVGTVYHRVTQ